jgi:hypothetical protein
MERTQQSDQKSQQPEKNRQNMQTDRIQLDKPQPERTQLDRKPRERPQRDKTLTDITQPAKTPQSEHSERTAGIQYIKTQPDNKQSGKTKYNRKKKMYDGRNRVEAQSEHRQAEHFT